MPRKPPAEPIDHHYNIPKLNRAFFISGAVLAVVFIWMVVADYTRDWKPLQRSFMRLDAKKTREAAAAAREKAYGDEREKLRAQLAEGRQKIEGHTADLAQLNKHLQALDPKLYAADQDYKFAKASF